MIVTFLYKYQKDGIDMEKKIKCRTNNIAHLGDKRFITSLGIWVNKNDIIEIT